MSNAVLGLRIKQQLTLTPRLQQSVKLLQLSALSDLYSALVRSPHPAGVTALDPYLAALAAYVTVIGLSGRPRWRNWFALAIVFYCLTSVVLAPHYTPLHLGLLFLPELGGAVLTAIAFGAVFSTRFIHYFTLFGMACLAVGIVVILGAVPPTTGLTLAGSALIGVGVGASVVPALFLAGFSLRAANIQRVFAILELMRAIAAFMIVPILLHFATSLDGFPTAATGTALWVCFGLAAGGAVIGVLLYLLGGVKPPAPSVQRFLGGNEPGWESPRLLATIRRQRP